MPTQSSIEERLWDYIDGLTPAEEKSAIEQLIDSNIEWRNKYHELLDVHQLMSKSLELDEPSMRFTQNVMEDIAKLHIAHRSHIGVAQRKGAHHQQGDEHQHDHADDENCAALAAARRRPRPG